MKLTPRTAAADRAYRRLARRDSRRALEFACVLAALTEVVSTAIGIARDVDPRTTLVLVLMTLAFAIAAVAVRRVPSAWLDPVAGTVAGLAVASSITAISSFPIFTSPSSVGIVGLIPMAVALFALWDLRAHLVWLSACSLVVAVLLVLGRDEAELVQASPAVILGWVVGGGVSVVGQQVLARGRQASVAAVAMAHASRGRGAVELRRLRTLEAIGRALSEDGPTDQTLDAAMHLLRDEFGYAYPAIYLGNDQLMRLGAQLGYDAPVIEVRSDRGVIGRVMRTQQPVLLASVEGDPDYVGASPTARSEIVVPLLADSRFLGALNVESGFTLGPDDLASVSIVADRFAAAIALADRRAALHTTLEASPVPILAINPDGTINYWNAAATDVFGWTADEVKDRPSPLHVPDEPIAVEIERHIAGGERVAGIDAERRHHDGHLVPVRIFAAPFGDRPPYGTIAVYQDLTAERAASAALVESEARFETVVGALREGIIVLAPDHTIVWANAAAARMLGRDPEQLVGRSPWVGGWSAIHEDGRPFPVEESPLVEALRTGVPVIGTRVGMPRADGTVVWIEGDTVLLQRTPDEAPYAVVMSLYDITDHKRQADELRLAERRVRSVLEQASNPIVGVDTHGLITFANARVTALFGYAPDDLVGRPVEVLVPDAHVEAHVGLRERYLDRPVPRPMGIGRELSAKHRDGTIVPVEIAINPVETPTGLEFYATLVDTTERRRIEGELLQAAKLDSIGRLAGGIAHDFNNLLTAIIGYGRIATDELPEASPARADIDQMLLAADRAADLTRQLLGFARKTQLDPATHDLNAIVAGLEPFLDRLLGERIALVTNLGPSAGHIRVDRSQVDQILINLVANARDAMPDGGTLVIATTVLDAVDVDGLLELRGDRIVLLSVSDTGIGMTEAVRARVFEPFYTTKPFGEGTGLGLATTYGIVHQSGGAITVDSAPGAGTTFRVYFPQVAAVDGASGAARGPVAPADDELTVLVVEDEESVRTLVARMLERLGYRVLQAPNGAAAMSLVGTRLGEVDLLLTDVVMPGMRGTELAEALRAVRPGLPVVFMSGYAADDAAGGFPDGAALLGKPFSLDDLHGTVTRLVRGVATTRAG